MVSSDARSPRHRQEGFTYLWTLMTVALLGAGLAIAADVHALSMQRERERELLFIGHQFRAALRSYYHSSAQAGQRQFPSSLEELLQDPRFPGTKRHLRRIYTDPMTGSTEWGTVRMGGRIVGIHSLSERRPIKQDNFDLEDEALRSREKYSEWIFSYQPADMIATEAPAVGPGGTRNEVGE